MSDPERYDFQIDIEHVGKLGSCKVRIIEVPGKRAKTSDHRLKGQQGRSQYNTCGKVHKGVFRSRGLGCYKCGGVGHVNRYCPHGASPLYFHCD